SCTGPNACDGAGACKPIAGRPCTSGGDCASGFCADSICCNAACTGQCEACDLAGAVGKCTPTSGAPRGNRPACAGAPSGNVCGAATCNGITTDSCAGFVGETAICSLAACTSGTATLVTRCVGNGACPDPVTLMCSPYVCQGD